MRRGDRFNPAAPATASYPAARGPPLPGCRPPPTVSPPPPGPKQVRRRVAALREVQSKQDEIMRGFIRERAELEAKYQKQLGGF